MAFKNIEYALFILLISLNGCSFFSSSIPTPLQWSTNHDDVSFSHVMNNQNDSEMVIFRIENSIDELKSKNNNNYETLKNIVKWTHDQWLHNGKQEPTSSDPLTILREVSEGQNFRCVEYAIIVAASAQCLGLPARVLSLRRKDVETAKYNAGHVVAEVWIDEFDKWVMADAQAGVIAEMDGIPLNAVELQENMTKIGSNLQLQGSSNIRPRKYINWISSYLYYFQVVVDQKFYPLSSKQDKEKIMLVPKGAIKPTIFQREYPIENCIYVSNPETFYPKISLNEDNLVE